MYSDIHSDPPGHLPVPLSPFIGRRREIAELKGRLEEVRLLTLIGPGGCGKTRLALQIASEQSSLYPDGVWLTELAPLSEGELVFQAVAATLGVREKAGQPARTAVLNYLRPRQLLLVLDNCEHLIDAAAQLSANILGHCPGVRLLATSREPLRIPGEMVWSVPPLSLPVPQPWRRPTSEQEALAAYQQSEAVQLFIDRAAAAFPAFHLDPQNAPWVAEVCRRLDGLPLAIELAAARLRIFTVRQIAERLDDRFNLLTSRMRTVPQRHQTLEAALDWSYELLSPAEKTMLQRLSVFAAGWTLDAAEAVCSPDENQPHEIVDLLSNLVDKSLVAAHLSHGQVRYRLLETIRQYAARKLAASGEVESVRNRHLAYYLRWAREGASHLSGSDQSGWLMIYESEHDNLRAALEWSLKAPDRAEQGLALAAECGQFWRLRGYLSEGRERLAAALSLKDVQKSSPARAKALLWAANLAYVQSDYPATRPLAEEGLEISRGLSPEGKQSVAWGLDLLGELATEVGDYEQAPGFFLEALEIYQELEDQSGIVDMHMQLGWAAMRMGDYSLAETHMNQCLSLLSLRNQAALSGLILAGLGELAIRQKQLEQAAQYLEQSLAIRREQRDRWGMAVTLGSLGWVALLQRNLSLMQTTLGESLAIRIEIDDRGGIAWCLEKLAEASMFQAQSLPASHRRAALGHAVRLYGAAFNLRAPIHSVVDPVDQPEYERNKETLIHSLGKFAFQAAWEEGSEIPLQELAEFALSPQLTQAEAARLTDSQVTRAQFGGLTPREREAARLIAQGKTNQEIAKIMVVGVKTVETYVTRILNKLNMDSRVQIAVWAHETGLVGSGETNT